MNRLLVQSKVMHRGQRFGRWTVIGDPFRCGGYTAVVTACDCGSVGVVNAQVLRLGRSKSCGCYSRESSSERSTTHGLTNHKLYGVFKAMWRRCTDPKNKSYPDYGGRGIHVCMAWQSFDRFFAWAIEHGWENGKQIDRINNDGGYSRLNCRFVTATKNGRNKRSNVLLAAFGEAKTPPEWAADPRCAVSEICIRKRIGRGWSDGEKILTVPARLSVP